MSDTATADIYPETPREDRGIRSRRGRRALALILLLLLALLALASFLLIRLITPPGRSAAADTGGLEWVRSIYGTSQALEDQFDKTQAAVPAPDGAIWITDSAKRSLMRFTPDGRFTNAIKGPAEGTLTAPSRMDVGPDGKLYVCETNLDFVRVFRPDGTEEGSFPIPKPVSIEVTEDRIIVGAVAGFAILNKEGDPIKVMGERGKGDIQFDYVHGVAVDDSGNIYVADSFNNRLSAYDKDGKRLWIVRTGKPSNSAEMKGNKLDVGETADVALKGDQALQLPLGLTIDGAGRIVVIDMFECALAVFDSKDGSFIGKYGTAGADDGQFFYPVSVEYDAERDWFTVADNLNNRVQIVRLPDSSAGGDALAAARRTLAGPLRACLFPLLLLLLAIIVWLVMRNRNRRRDAETVLPEDDELAAIAQ